MAIFVPARRWRASGNQIQLESDLYYPDSLGDLYGRVTELLGFAAGADEHKVQWLSTADDGAAYLPLFEEILGNSEWPRHQSQLLRRRSPQPGRLQRKVLPPCGPRPTAKTIPQKLKAPLAAGLQRAVERAVLRMAGPVEQAVHRGRPGSQRAAHQLARSFQRSFRPARRRKYRNRARGRVLRLEQRLRSKQARLVRTIYASALPIQAKKSRR